MSRSSTTIIGGKSSTKLRRSIRLASMQSYSASITIVSPSPSTPTPPPNKQLIGETVCGLQMSFHVELRTDGYFIIKSQDFSILLILTQKEKELRITIPKQELYGSILKENITMDYDDSSDIYFIQVNYNNHYWLIPILPNDIYRMFETNHESWGVGDDCDDFKLPLYDDDDDDDDSDDDDDDDAI